MKNPARKRPWSGPCPAPKRQKAATVAKLVACGAPAQARPSSGPCPAPKKQKAATAAKLVACGAPAQARKATVAKLVASGARDLGTVDISDELHCKHCLHDHSRCPRCAYARSKGKWHQWFPWLAVVPKKLGSSWSLGCTVCRKAFCVRAQGETGSKGVRGKDWRKGPRLSTFARFAYRGRLKIPTGKGAQSLTSLMEMDFRSHACTQSHIASTRSRRSHTVADEPLSSGDAQVAAAAGNACFDAKVAAGAGNACFPDMISDDPRELAAFRGRVPQLGDWEDCLIEVGSLTSFRKQERLKSLRKLRGDTKVRSDRRKQARIIAEVRRQRIRNKLRKAKCITLVF